MKPILLTILDGFGMSDEVYGNAIKNAKTPNFDYLWNNYPHSLLSASGEDVGLPGDQMGNSEVGHLNIGAGRVVLQPLQIINNSIMDGSILTNKNLLKVIDHVKNNNSKLHIMGLCSDGGVHSHINHILSLIDMAKKNNIDKLYIHMFLDGRDTFPNIGMKFVDMIENKLKETRIGSIATVSGRYFAMDRDNNWDRTKKVYDVMINAVGDIEASASLVVQNNYEKEIYDEFIMPSVIDRNGMIDSNDGIIYTNFRTDRAVQLLKAIKDSDFNEFKTKELNDVEIALLMPSAKLKLPSAFESLKLNNTFGEYISNLGYRQLRIAETEKYAHVTYFFDGLEDKKIEGCDRILINSPKVRTYDLKPEMSAYEITDELINAIKENKYDIIILNYANADMVGHTGDMKATIKAVEAIDDCIGKVYRVIKDMNGLMMITADHGNAEYMLDRDNRKITSHTMNKTPFIVCGENYKVKDGRLSDIVPSILNILEEDIPDDMTGNIIIEK